LTQLTNIVETVIAPPPSNYEGYLYSYTNLITNQIYLGIHKGSVDDEYSHSSTNADFAEVFVDSDSKLKFEVIDYGDYTEMQQIENVTLTKVDARKNPLYYNKSNGFPVYKQTDRAKCKALSVRILAGEFDVGKEPIGTHTSMIALQVRFKHDAVLQRIIKEKVDEALGNTDKCSRVLVWEGRGENGEDLRGDGNHTVWGASSSKHCVDIPAARVPYEIHKDYSHEELKAIGNLLNKRPDIIKKHMDEDDGVKHILDNYEVGVPCDSTSNIDWLKDFGFTGTPTKGAIRAIIKKAQVLADKNDLAKSGVLWKNYNAKPHHQEMLDMVDTFSRQPKTTSVYMSSLKFSSDRILDRLYATRPTEAKKSMGIEEVNRIVVVIHHASPEAEENWKINVQPAWLNIIKYTINVNLEVKFYEMETTENDLSKGMTVEAA
jgi:hypothetical protein